MRMYRCDRCGELVSSSYKGFIRKPYRGVYRFGKKAHLCPDCAEDLRKWMKGCQFADAGALREVVDELECAYRPEDYASVDALCELSNDASKALAKRIRKAVGL